MSARKLQASDVDTVIAIGKDSPQASNWSRESYLKLIEEEGSVALVAEIHVEICGFLIARRVADQAEILNLAVDTKHRTKGHGSALLKAALAEVRLRATKTVYLEVRESNTTAITFYERHGFAKTGLRKDYYRDPVEAAITMEKKLTG